MSNTSSTIHHAVRIAKESISESGENPEYDRAVVEFLCDLLSFPSDLKFEVAVLLGVTGKSLEALR